MKAPKRNPCLDLSPLNSEESTNMKFCYQIFFQYPKVKEKNRAG